MTESVHIMQLYKNLMAAQIHLFPIKGKVNVSVKHGVYVIYSPTSEVLHVGMTPYGKEGLNQRLYNHISKTGIFYREYLKPRNISLRGTHKFQYIEIENSRIRALLEALSAGLLCPAHFGTGVRRQILAD
jgi:hypothetical protein